MTDARNSFEYFREKNVQDIYSSEKEKHQTGSGWLRFLQDLPFEPDYSRKALKENRMPTKDVERLQSWGRECHGSITEKVACVGENKHLKIKVDVTSDSANDLRGAKKKDDKQLKDEKKRYEYFKNFLEQSGDNGSAFCPSLEVPDKVFWR